MATACRLIVKGSISVGFPMPIVRAMEHASGDL